MQYGWLLILCISMKLLYLVFFLSSFMVYERNSHDDERDATIGFCYPISIHLWVLKTIPLHPEQRFQ